MVRVRKLVLAIAAASALTSGMAHALGLGEISLKSALNQPLDAEIELLEVRDLGGNEVLPSLAAVEEFNKVGVDRPYFLTDLKFTPVLKPNGKSVIRVTSSKPVREPYLNFLIEVLWPNGRLLREYTVLLDPPLYSPQTVVAATPRLPQAAPVAPRVSAPAPVSRPQPTASAPAAAAPVASSAASRLEGDQYRVGRDDTLWDIAEQARPSGALSVHQTMLAIQDLNPNAFLDGNINRMKSGQVLRLPSEQQIRSRSQADALAQVAAQNSAWREGRAVQPVAAAARQLDATRRSEAGNAPAQATAEDNLRLVSAASGKSTSGSDSGAAADSQGLADKLALNQESLATSQRENQELKERLGDLQSQLDKLQRLIELKNEQMAKLQGGLAADAATTAAADSAPAAEAEVAPVAAAAVQPAGESTTEAPLENKPQADAADAAAAPAPGAEPAADAAAPVAAESKPAPVAEAPKPAPAKPAVQPVAPAPVYEPSLVDEVLANPLLLAAGGGALALLAGLGLLAGSRRKARKQAEDEAQLFQEVGELPGANGGASASAESAEAALSAQSPAAAGGAPLASADPLGEAEMYSTYGRFTQAAEILRNAVNEEPQRADLRLKLMEVYAEMGDREGFVRQEAELGEIGGAQPQIDQLRARYPQILASGAAIAGGAALAAAVDGLDGEADGQQVLAEAMASRSQQADDEFSFDDLSLDDLSLDAAPGEASASSAELNEGFDLSLDDLEAELERELAANPGAAVEQPLELDELTLDGLDGELGGDLASFELSAAEPGAVAPAVAVAESDDLAFDLDLAALDLPASGQAAPQLASEDDFDFALDESLSTEAAGPGKVEQSDEDLFAELDQLSLDEPLQEIGAGAAQSDDALMAELDQMVLDTPLTTAPLATDDTDDFLLELADLELSEPVAAPQAAAQVEPEMTALTELDDLELELQALSGTDAEQDLDAAFDEFLAQSELSVPSAADVPAPAVEALAELPALDELVIEPAAALTGEEDFNFLADTDETATKLDLARAYIDMGDADGARDILDEVLKEGSTSQQQEAREMMGRIA
ncbi:hypothetical protein D3C78_509160 [compost metagenome]